MAVGSSVSNVGCLVSWEGDARRTDPAAEVQPGTLTAGIHCSTPDMGALSE